MDPITVRPIGADDRAEVARLLTELWGDRYVVAHGVRYDPSRLAGFLAERDGAVAGLLTYTLRDRALEVVTIDALERCGGVGSALLAAAVQYATDALLRRVWLVTTTDNLDAIRFYQRRGLRPVRVRPGAVDLARTRKPGIPAVGEYGIALRDELVFELRLDHAVDLYADPVGTARATVGRICAGRSPEEVAAAVLGDPVATADVVRGLAYPHLGDVDAVLPAGPAVELAALVAGELAVPLLLDRPAAGARVLVVADHGGWLGEAPEMLTQLTEPAEDEPVGLTAAAVPTGAAADAPRIFLPRVAVARKPKLAAIALVVDDLPAEARELFADAGVPVRALATPADLRA